MWARNFFPCVFPVVFSQPFPIFQVEAGDSGAWGLGNPDAWVLPGIRPRNIAAKGSTL